jgi:ADP-dependent NAD(P)H-hydrate dehydratase
MSNPSEDVTVELLRTWGLPAPGDSKKSRGRVMVVGGSTRSPGGVMLAGEAALRVGAGRLGLVVPLPIQPGVALALPEAAVFALPDRAADPLERSLAEELGSADAVLIGPGFDDAAETRATILSIAAAGIACLVLDAFALGVLPDVPRDRLPTHLILNPNEEEAAILLGRDLADDRPAEIAEIARRYGAVVNCYGTIAEPGGTVWTVTGGGPGLGTSGSGDVLAGAISGFAGRGLDTARAAVWGSWTHAHAGDRLEARMGLGFLARELARELPVALADVAGTMSS